MEDEKIYTQYCFQRQLWMGRTCFQSGAPGRFLIYPPIHLSAEASRILAVSRCSHSTGNSTTGNCFFPPDSELL